MVKISFLFDCNDYPDDHPCFDNVSPNSVKDIKQRNRKVICKFRDELEGIPFEEFVGLRSKLYSMMYMKERVFEVDEEGEERVVEESSFTSFKRIEKMEDRKSANGVKRAVKDHHLIHSRYKYTLMSLGEYPVSQNLMISQDHVVTNRNVKKVALIGYDK